MRSAIRSAPAAAGRWLRSVRPDRAHLRADLVAGLTGAVSGLPDGMASAVLAGVNPAQGLYAQLHRAYRRRSQLRYPDDGDHDDIRCRAGRGLGPAGCPVGAAASGDPAADGDGRCRAGRRRDRPPWPLHQVRFPLGDDRVPDRYRGQHRVQPGRRSHRGSRARRLPAGQSPQRPRPSGRHRPGGAADRVVRARHPGGAVVHPARGGESAHRPGDPHARGGPRGRGQGGQGRRPG